MRRSSPLTGRPEQWLFLGDMRTREGRSDQTRGCSICQPKRVHLLQRTNRFRRLAKSVVTMSTSTKAIVATDGAQWVQSFSRILGRPSWSTRSEPPRPKTKRFGVSSTQTIGSCTTVRTNVESVHCCFVPTQALTGLSRLLCIWAPQPRTRGNTNIQSDPSRWQISCFHHDRKARGQVWSLR